MQKKKKTQRSPSELRPVKTFKCEKCYFTGQKVKAQPPSVTGGATTNILRSQRLCGNLYGLFSEEHPGFKDSEIIRFWTLPSQIREQSGFTKKPIGLGPNLKDNRLDSFYRTVS